MSVALALDLPSGPALRRVRKEDVVQPAFGKRDAYSVCMACWVDFMRTDDRDLSAAGMKLTGGGEDARDIHERQRAADLKVGEAVNAMVESLSMRDRWAIYKSQGISNVWRFPNADFATVLSEARVDLEKKLRTNVATRLYFA